MPTSSLHLDSAAVKVLAHPLRSRLLSALRAGGPSTATGLAAVLETHTGATSYHLRRLASVGLVVDTGEGEGRRRLWRAATESHSFDASDFADDEDAATALDWLLRHYLATFVRDFQHWLDVQDAWPGAWRDGSSFDDARVRVTAEQLQRMRTELRAVVERYAEAGADDPEARDVVVAMAAYPRGSRPGS